MFEMGFAVGLGLIVILAKAPWHAKIGMASHPAKMDLGVFIILMLLHWGTFSGVMVASIGALMVSLVLSAFRKVYGYKVKGKYVRGMVDVAHRLNKKQRGTAYAHA